MTQSYFIRSYAAGEFANRFAMVQLIKKRSPHLQNRVGKARLKYSAVILEYDARGRIIKVTQDINETEPAYLQDKVIYHVGYSYYNNGDTSSRTIQSSTTNFGYTGNQMASATGGESFSLNYDENGNLTLIDDNSDTELEYNWDEEAILSFSEASNYYCEFSSAISSCSGSISSSN